MNIYRFIIRNSYEHEMFDIAGLKLGLDKAILQRMNFVEDEPIQIEQLDDHSKGRSCLEQNVKKEDTIQLLLRKGAYGETSR
jgi:SNF2 family DNA or RNA helicase